MTVINTNNAALKAQLASKIADRKLTESGQRLSSGKRINGGADDAAGAAVALKLDAQMQGQKAAIKTGSKASSIAVAKGLCFANKLDLKLFHRGPDAKGNFKTYIKSNNILFHRRLSILEISDKGSQPMLSNDKNLAICFNGEIYNHLEIRKKLDKEFNISWKGNSDTETLIESFSQLGIEKTINMIEGMYAFALLDINNEKLYLGRDLFGEKPLYFYRNKENLIFSSEVHNVDENFFTINQSAIFQFLHYNYIPNSNCIYNNWEKVNPGEVIVFDKNLKSKKIFDLKDCISKEINLSRNLSQNEAGCSREGDYPCPNCRRKCYL